MHKRLELGIDRKLVSDHSPILYAGAVPFGVQFAGSQIEQFKQGVFVREGALFRYLPETRMYALDRIRRIHNLTDSAAVVE